eukprot:CAMPEP_0197242040 /NCGR_PEP_ID=MMETSP1429-20130617/7897_1 /TAXON_ID=49237 /ORGANISM="Chaetoceros  sp., Strain UNC1202" /LENGTH=371 /DNA_ID=CAMNT_0042701979 /DNA_START=54 /DNA_END=1169 /DNA_ORIENTATION=-
MYDKGNGKSSSTPLPSMLSNIRNVGRAAVLDQPSNEARPLIQMKTSPSVGNLTSPPFNISRSASGSPRPSRSGGAEPGTPGIRNSNQVQLFMDRIKASSLFQRNRDRLRFRQRPRLRRRGFAVNIPDRMVLYTILIFFVFPLFFGMFFLFRQVLFGSLKEDEMHPLHKKEPHFHPDAIGNGPVTVLEKNVTSLSDTTLLLDSIKSEGNEQTMEVKDPSLLSELESSVKKQPQSQNPLDDSTDAMGQNAAIITVVGDNDSVTMPGNDIDGRGKSQSDEIREVTKTKVTANLGSELMDSSNTGSNNDDADEGGEKYTNDDADDGGEKYTNDNDQESRHSSRSESESIGGLRGSVTVQDSATTDSTQKNPSVTP